MSEKTAEEREGVTRSESISGDRAKLLCHHFRVIWRCRVCGEVRAAVAEQREKDAKIAEEYAVKEHEDVAVTGSSIMYYSELIAGAIRAGKPEPKEGGPNAS